MSPPNPESKTVTAPAEPKIAGQTKFAAPGSLSRWILRLVLIAALILAAKYFGWFPHLKAGFEWLQSELDLVVQWIGGLGAWGPIIFICAYIIACVAFIPASILTLGAGAIFGVVHGSIYVSIGATLGASAAFLVGRYFARAWIAKRMGANPTFAAIDRALAAEGWKIVALTRLSPVFPFVLMNYAFGVTRVSFRHYFFASWVGTMPASVMYVYIGSLAKAAGGPRPPAEIALRVVGLIATVVATIFITRIARKALAEKTSK
jgi:uncharacterized membrane protein YdjX (TVP38/TMEM64 family)